MLSLFLEWLSHAHHAAGTTSMHHPASTASNPTNPQNYQNLPLPHAAHWTDLNIKLERNEENQNSAKNSIMSSSSSNDSTRSHKIVTIQKYFRNVKKWQT